MSLVIDRFTLHVLYALFSVSKIKQHAKIVRFCVRSITELNQPQQSSSQKHSAQTNFYRISFKRNDYFQTPHNEFDLVKRILE